MKRAHRGLCTLLARLATCQRRANAGEQAIVTTRLAKDFENLNRNALAFIQLASIRLMLRKLSNSK